MIKRLVGHNGVRLICNELLSLIIKPLLRTMEVFCGNIVIERK